MRVITIVGARPQLVKAAAVSRVLRATPGMEEVLVHTGQHFDSLMSEVFFDQLGIPAPAYDLGVHGGGHGDMTGRMLIGLEPVVIRERPDMVVVYGDTNSTLAGALVASKLHVPVAHVEAGLRSFNRSMPEEVNRVLTDHVSDILLCPTSTAVANLEAEGIRRNVHHVGDVMYDATLDAVDRAAATSTILTDLQLTPGAYDVATFHRAENTDDRSRLREIVNYLIIQAKRRPLVIPLHPRTRSALAAERLTMAPAITIDPLGYLDMVQLVHHASHVFTDSGGLQKEAYFHRVPCITLREETEWVETVRAGWNRLWRSREPAPEKYDIPDYGDGGAAQRVVDLMATFEATDA